MQQFVHRIWYSKWHVAAWLLLPLSWTFGVISAFRRLLFKTGLKKSYRSPVPVIVVGNITAGGSGKTPMVLHLISLLRQAGYHPGVISRGYGANVESATFVNYQSQACDVGDEPAMIFARTQVPIVVGIKRVEAIQLLLKHCDVDVVICDDGLQHYALDRDIEINIVDGERGLGNGHYLPAGPLREKPWRLKTVDFIVVNNDKHIHPSLLQYQYYPMHLMTDDIIALKKSANLCQPKKGDTIVAMAGIGNPKRFFDSLYEQGFKLSHTHEFLDHKAYQENEIASLSHRLPLLMTEKDAVKCQKFAHENWWYVTVTAQLPKEFDHLLLKKLKNIIIQ